MKAAVGDRIAIAANGSDGPIRDGEVLSVRADGGGPFRVRWSESGGDVVLPRTRCARPAFRARHIVSAVKGDQWHQGVRAVQPSGNDSNRARDDPSSYQELAGRHLPLRGPPLH
jgi:hypothetical protein